MDNLIINNIVCYKFVKIPKDFLMELKGKLLRAGIYFNLKGTILVSTEGVNMFLAASKDNIDGFTKYLSNEYEYFKELEIKYSYSEFLPFKNFRVRIRPEIITIRTPKLEELSSIDTYICSEDTARYLDAGVDDVGRPVVMLDLRNNFELEIGKFNNAIDFGLESFSELGSKLDDSLCISEELKNSTTIISYCTGGIRCEKGVPVLKKFGFKHVYQLKGGILKYFEEVGGRHYSGKCFVFDGRHALDSNLQPDKKSL